MNLRQTYEVDTLMKAFIVIFFRKDHRVGLLSLEKIIIDQPKINGKLRMSDFLYVRDRDDNDSFFIYYNT